LDKPLLYTDFKGGLWAQVHPRSELNAWRKGEEEVRHIFSSTFGHAPPVAQEMGRQLKVRLVFGLEALREKVLCQQHGLDDIALELFKRELWLQFPVLQELPPATALRLSRVTPTHFAFNAEPPMNITSTIGFQVDRAPLSQLPLATLKPSYRALMRGPWVDWLRYATVLA
jgi:hypothetical protein